MLAHAWFPTRAVYPPSTQEGGSRRRRGAGPPPGEGGMSAKSGRMQLSADQRAVLEAVYAIEKLPDAALRERLSSYLSLSARQIQAG